MGMDVGWVASCAGALALVTRELIVAAALLIAIGCVDDLLVDLLYFGRRLWRAVTVYSRHDRATADLLALPDRPGAMAILIPAWDESAVIAKMLKGALRRFDHPHYRLFVGAYPNDPFTIAAISEIADPRVIPVIAREDGPTNKANCLNTIWRTVLEEERRTGVRFKAIVLHDAEDIVHSMELRIFDRLIERFDMVQLPVQPLPDPQSPWISGHYLDEFTESHGKDLVVREALGAAVPSAGVGCAIRREMIDRIVALNGGVPFDEGSVTEDYELGLKIGALGGRGILVRLPAASGQLVATREHFPATLEDAVRQKARWLAGIALHGWDRLGWRGGLAERWMRLRDRKAVAGAIATLLAYLGAVGFGLVILLDHLWPALALSSVVEPGGATSGLLMFNAVMLGWRLAMRFSFTASVYGWVEGLRAIPRALIANIIAILACWRAITTVARALRQRQARPYWDKTAHKFPAILPGE